VNVTTPRLITRVTYDFPRKCYVFIFSISVKLGSTAESDRGP
jgi:hypothetical protein